MNGVRSTTSARSLDIPDGTGLLEQYGCGPIQFGGTNDALYDRHLLFDNIVDAAAVSPRERYEAIARSVRDVLSQRWLRTEQTYERENPKRIYYLSMEFLIGRSLANNVMNLLLDPIARRFSDEKGLDLVALLEEEPDAGLGNGGLGRLAACFINSMATLQLPATGYGTPLRVWHLQAVHQGWLATRTARQLAAPARSMGGGTAAREGGGQARLLVRSTGRDVGRGSRPPINPDRPSV